MRNNISKIYQQTAFIQAQRLVCLLLLLEYAKRVAESEASVAPQYLDSVIGSQASSTSTSTFTFTSVSLVEGDNLISAKTSHRGGDSAWSPDYKITVDTGVLFQYLWDGQNESNGMDDINDINDTVVCKQGGRCV